MLVYVLCNMVIQGDGNLIMNEHRHWGVVITFLAYMMMVVIFLHSGRRANDKGP